MKQHFSIGQTARINGVPVKTLRYYDEIGLLHPSYVHPETGYRYYTQEQFYLIDIIKFAKRLGLSLEDTKALMVPGSLENMIELLELQQQRAEQQLQDLMAMRRTIDRHLEDLRRVQAYAHTRLPYLREREAWHVVLTCRGGNWDELDLALKDCIQRPALAPYLTYRYGILLDTQALSQRRFVLRGAYMHLSACPADPPEEVHTLPGGSYACFPCRFFAGDTDWGGLPEYLQAHPETPPIQPADDLYYIPDWEQSQHEVQIFLPTDPNGAP